VKTDGTHWLQPELKAFFNTKLQYSNTEYNEKQQKRHIKNQNKQSKEERIYNLKKLPNRIAKKNIRRKQI
jgi:hypothetical protein